MGFQHVPFPHLDRSAMPGNRRDAFMEGEWCRRCGGTGHVVFRGRVYEPCYCCQGTGRRNQHDHARCVWYWRTHPQYRYECAEFIAAPRRAA